MMDTYSNWISALRNVTTSPESSRLHQFKALGCFANRLIGGHYAGKSLEDAIEDLNVPKVIMFAAMVFHERWNPDEVGQLEKLNLTWPMIHALTLIDSHSSRLEIAIQASREQWGLRKVKMAAEKVRRLESPLEFIRWKKVKRKWKQDKSNRHPQRPG
ncbi:MAG: hypothetical protein M5U26_13225 [Planctomycetota bacterium]|nr:hypothetical protein [Planctomycetota bacterium]